MNDARKDERLEKRLNQLEALKYHAWDLFESAETGRERLAALKMVADIVLLQIKQDKDSTTPKEDENARFYREELRRLGERIRLLTQRRGIEGPQQGA
jgi:hypothetical protein